MAEKKIDLISAQDGCGDDRPLSWVLADVHRLKPGFQTRTMEDIDWLLKRRIAFQLSQQGIPVRIPQRTVGLGRRMYTILAGSLPNRQWQHLDKREFGPVLRWEIGDHYILFTTVIQKALPLPDEALESQATARWLYGREGCVICWHGLALNLQKADPSLVQFVQTAPVKEDHSIWPPISSAYMTKFMKYHCHLEGTEEELRDRLGYPQKGGLVSERILARSVMRVFDGEAVRTRYRGRELNGLELDVFVPERRLAFEYQGDQHFRKLSHWHGSGDSGFLAQQARDQKKKELCQRLGYDLVYFNDSDELRPQDIVRRLREMHLITPEFCAASTTSLYDGVLKSSGVFRDLPPKMSHAEGVALLSKNWKPK